MNLRQNKYNKSIQLLETDPRLYKKKLVIQKVMNKRVCKSRRFY